MAGTEAALETLAAPRGRRRSWLSLRVLVELILAGLLTVLGAEAGRVFCGSNWHEVLPGRVYRGAQTTPQQLEGILDRYAIRTVVNLRGCCNPWPWYLEQGRVLQRRQVSQEDICFSAGRLPCVPELRRLVEVLDQAEYPLFLHCRRGADRTGLASAVVLLLYTDSSLGQARRQLGWRYGHVALGRPAHLDLFLDLYADWLRQQGQVHSRQGFRHWLLEEYRHSWCSYAVEQVESLAGLRCGAPLALRVHFRNTGVRTWPFRPGKHAGVHAAFVLWDPDDQQVADGRAGFFAKEVAPGETVAVTVVVPPLPRPGKYRLLLDLIDEQQGWFFQMGAEPREEELEVRE